MALKENNVQPGKKQYELLCKFFKCCQDAISLANSNVEKFKAEIEKTVKGKRGSRTRITEGKIFSVLLTTTHSILHGGVLKLM